MAKFFCNVFMGMVNNKKTDLDFFKNLLND